MATSQQHFIVHPYKFNLWLFILSSIMAFGALTSAYIVSRSFVPVNLLVIFTVPNIVKINTLLLVVSSIVVQFSVWSVKRNEDNRAIMALIMTLILGFAFLFGQWNAWEQMVGSGLHFVNKMRKDSSISFFYIFSGLHAVHIIGALIVVLYGIVKTRLNNFKEGNKVLTFEIIATFWHFLGLLWIYLYFFIVYTQKS
jgi:cytochrome c oxidase subunit III